MGSGIKKTFGEVEAAFNQRGFTLLSTEYKNSSSPLEYLCSNGHQSKISFNSLQQGKGCAECAGKKTKTIEEVRMAFDSRGFTLLSKDYQDVKTSLDYICDQCHQTKISFANLQIGQGCAECAGLKKKTIEEVEVAFNQRGFTLLSTEYKGNKSPLTYICGKGHQTKISFSHLQNGKGCLECSGKKTKTIEKVRELFIARNYTLLSTEYKNNISPLNYICSNRHQTKIRFADLQSGKGCAECGGKKKKTIEEVRVAFESKGFTLLSKDYQDSKTPLNYLCSNNHNGMICFDNLKSGKGCAECSFDSKRKTIEEVRELFASRNFKLLSTEYKGNKSPLTYICGKGHQTKISFDNLQQGKGCASCAEYGFNPNKSAILYYLRFQFEGNFYYKIGITNRNILERFRLEKIPYTVIKETAYTMGKEAYTQEQAILKKFSAYRYKGKPFLTMRGDTELFIKDVLQIDYEPLQNFAA